MIKSSLCLLVLSQLLTSLAFAFPLPTWQTSRERSMVELPSTFGQGYDFEGIVALSNCSGSLIQLEGASDSDFGLILTNGHCYEGGFTRPGSYVFGVPSRRTFTLLNSAAKSVGRVTARVVVYSTMTNTDMTIYQLRETYSEIKTKFGIRPLTLSSQHPSQTTPMEVVSGYWLRGYSCEIEAFISQLREEDWFFSDSIRYTRPGCETIGGTSGSPIVAAGTKTVIGVNNTGNESGERCTMNNPCEIDQNGEVTSNKGYSYGQQTYWVYSCLNKSKEIDLTIPGCLLPH
ncbi:MAG: trypsin-like peptidase domain-containing protein [Bdellovibrionaceae bacterium]|nr:trypsin-like peptidase domain-containing protein [Pseudobdellovibrionaceae bacterium]